MKLLLTSNGLSNDSIAKAFQGLVGKDPKDSKVAFIPTAANVVRGNKDWLIDDLYRIKSRGYYVDVLEIASLMQAEIENVLKESDAIFVGGGNIHYLSYWMQQKGLFELIPELLKTKVYAGISAGSIVAGASLLSSKAIKDGYIDEHYMGRSTKDESSDKALKLVDIIFRPHYKSPDRPMLTEENLAKIAPSLEHPMYALDDDSALKIVDGKIEIISEGEWKLFDNK